MNTRKLTMNKLRCPKCGSDLDCLWDHDLDKDEIICHKICYTCGYEDIYDERLNWSTVSKYISKYICLAKLLVMMGCDIL